MTDAEKIAMLTTITGETDNDALTSYLFLAGQIILRKAYPYGDGSEEMPSKYDGLQIEIAAFLLNKRGAEGEVQHSENGVSRIYENGDIPANLLRRIIPEVKVL